MTMCNMAVEAGARSSALAPTPESKTCVNLPEQNIRLADGSVIPFEIDQLRKQSLPLQR